MNARVALAALLSLLALLPSPTEQASFRIKRRADPPWARPSSQEYPSGPPGHAGGSGNKHGGPPRGGPPGLAGGGPPGLNGKGQGNHGRPGGKPSGNGRPGGNTPDYEKPSGGDEGVYSTVRPPYEDPNQNRCKKYEFKCGSGECLPASVRCDNRFDCSDSSDERLCITDRTSESGCVLPAQPEGGSYELGGCGTPCSKHSGDKVPRNSILAYTCRDNYVLNGSAIPVCVDDEWRNLPSCLKTCPALTSSSVKISCTYHGETVSCTDRIKPGTRATLSCKDSYKLPITNDPGYRDITCLETGLWDLQLFRCLPECGISTPKGNTLVVNGFTAKIGVFPWHVGIYMKNSDAEYEQICGGSLISSSLVVSAAHCFYDDAYKKVGDKSQYAVAGGKHYRDWNAVEEYAQKSPVDEIFLADRYIGARGNFAQDIAIVKLTSPFELTALVRPICIDWDNAHEREQLQIGHTGKAVGWGKTITGEASEELQELNMPFVPYHQCLSTVPDDFRGYITPDKFCAGQLNGTSLCEGDSGGGLCFEDQGIWYLRGIVSVSPAKAGTCDYNSYVGFTYISYFRDWIRAAYVRT